MEELEEGVVLASESGLTDSSYVKERSNWIDAAFLGGTNADEKTLNAALEMVSRGRKEFLTRSKKFARRELKNLKDTDIIGGVNVRSSSLEPLLEVAEIIDRYNGILEVNAHCRQPEMIQTGCGHKLMKDKSRLSRWIEEIKKTGVTVSIKTRAEIVDTEELAITIEKAGGDIIHIDCMDSPEVINDISRNTDLFIIANNGVRSHKDFKEYIKRGADAVSTARGGRSNKILNRIAGPKIKNQEKIE